MLDEIPYQTLYILLQKVCLMLITGKAVKLGIEAPKNIVVHRKEVYEAIKNENLQAVPKETRNYNNRK